MNFSEEKIEEILFRENLMIAPLSYRIGACLIDILIVFFVAWAFCSYFYWHHSMNTIAMIVFIQKLLIYFLLFGFVYEIFLTGFWGMSVGKVIFKIKIISILTLDKPYFRFILLRSIVKSLEEMCFFVLFIFAFNERFFRTIHDRLAKTLVILNA